MEFIILIFILIFISLLIRSKKHKNKRISKQINKKFKKEVITKRNHNKPVTTTNKEKEYKHIEINQQTEESKKVIFRESLDKDTKNNIYRYAILREDYPGNENEKDYYKKCLKKVKLIEDKANENDIKITWCVHKSKPVYLKKDELAAREITEEEIQHIISIWERKPSYEFLLPDWRSNAIAGRYVNRGSWRDDHVDQSLNTIEVLKNYHLHDTEELSKIYKNKIDINFGNSNIFYIVKIKVPFKNKDNYNIYKPGICKDKVLGKRYKKENQNMIKTVVEIRNINAHIASNLEYKALYYMNQRPWLPQLYSHELIDSDYHGYFNDFYYKDFEMFEERYANYKNEIWTFNRKLISEIKNAQKRLEFAYENNKYQNRRERYKIDKGYKNTKEIKKDLKLLDKKQNRKDAEAKNTYDIRIKELTKIRKRLRLEYFKKIPMPNYSDKVWDYLKGGETEFRFWDEPEEKLFNWIKILMSFEQEKIEKYGCNPEVIFTKSN